jgi:hypothetical protein
LTSGSAPRADSSMKTEDLNAGKSRGTGARRLNLTLCEQIDTKAMGKIFSGARKPSHQFTLEPGFLAVREIGYSVNLSLYESVLRDDQLPRIPKHVLLYLVFRSDETHKCFPKQATIARQLKYSRQNVSAAITLLRAGGYIETKFTGRILIVHLSSRMTAGVLPQDSRCLENGHRTKPLTKHKNIAPSARSLSNRELEAIKESCVGSGMRLQEYLRQRGYSA